MIVAFLYLLLILFSLYPLSYTVIQSLHTQDGWSLSLYASVLSSSYFQDCFFTSLNLAIGTTLLTLFFALPIALLFARFNFYGRRFFYPLLCIPLIAPPFVASLGVKQLFGRYGTVNLLLVNHKFIDSPIDWLAPGSIAGIIILQSIHLFPIMLIILRNGVESLDQSLEEAAAICGASYPTRVRRIIIPLLLPALSAASILVFVGSFTDLGTPIFFELRQSLPVAIFNLLYDPSDGPLAYALITLVTLVCLIVFLFRSKNNLLEKSTAKHASRTRLIPLQGTFIGFLMPLLLILLIIFSLLPQIGTLLVALSEHWFMTPFPTQLTFDNFITVFSHPLTIRSIAISIILSLISTALCISLAFLLALFCARLRVRGAKGLDMLSMIPLVVPGLVIAFGYLRGFSGTILDPRLSPFPLLIAAYTIRRLPFSIRSIVSGFNSLSKSYEEAAATVGASLFTIQRRIIIPLLKPHLISGALFCFAFSMIEVSDSLILAIEERHYPISKALYALSGRPDGTELGCALGIIVSFVVGGTLAVANLISKRYEGRSISI
jgi:iron(III) transport system permease protein